MLYSVMLYYVMLRLCCFMLSHIILSKVTLRLFRNELSPLSQIEIQRSKGTPKNKSVRTRQWDTKNSCIMVRPNLMTCSLPRSLELIMT